MSKIIPMRPSQVLHAHRDLIRHIALRHRVRNVRIFGSTLRGEDTEASDLDLLVDPIAETTLIDIGAIRHELGKLLGVPVDVLTPNALPDSLRERILAEALPLCATGEVACAGISASYRRGDTKN